ncbi:sigma-54-dependent transcriptional regulator [Candidatus Electronema sp. JC]|uniref:sigma-54-dependent transcriptional regulator n=1 Tax=Candidatus Electronema sp. JC TaxID=3401570 RepID=UPI003AA95AC0
MKTPKAAKVLIVDDEQSNRYALNAVLSRWGWSCVEADDGQAAVDEVRKGPFDLVLMDVCMKQMDGLRALREIRAINPAIPVVMVTASSSIDFAVEAIKEGAHDYLTKPVDLERLRETAEIAMSHRLPPDEPEPHGGQPFDEDGRIIGSSPPMQELWEMILQVAPTEATVLISGESGTGKELVASALHYRSLRKDGPFVKVNCAALAENLLESELFGHEKGAFTGADRRREGCFVQAQHGTLFLDEIGETTPAMQAKLLRVLQEHEVQRVGGQEVISVDVRIVTATNRDLEAEVQEGRFREDLYYRLNVVTLDVPSLHERQSDIPLLTDFFIRRCAKRNKRLVKGITPDCMDILSRYPWPGNVRELENAIERCVILTRGEYLDVSGLPLAVQRWAEMHLRQEAAEPQGTLKEAELQLIVKTLAATGGNKSEAARRLQITRKTLLNKLKKHGLDSGLP